MSKGDIMKKIALITGSRETAKTLSQQLAHFLRRDMVLASYSVDTGAFYVSDVDLVIYSSELLYMELLDKRCVEASIPLVIGQRTINYDALEEVVSIPPRQKVLLVNDLKETAQHVYDALFDIGIDHLELGLFYPGCDMDTTSYQMAITPGETQYVPQHITHSIDIGSRIFDFKTIAKILTLLDIFEESSVSFSKMYLEKIINVAKRLAQSKLRVTSLNDDLKQVIQSFDSGVLVYDAHQTIIVCNEVLRQILKVKHYQVVGNRLNKIILNKRLLQFLSTPEDTYYECSFDGMAYAVSTFRLGDGDLTCATFRSNERHVFQKKIKDEAVKKGYIAKYSLDDIIGSSDRMLHLKGIIEKLAETDMNILIQGESGTGKELFASAIHSHSKRSDAPFLAVNFSALPDDLIESELFGYEEGAFTGAKKGGKMGLFEQANTGSIFLDEIGDISLKVQSRLLRVLEEREIMPVGGSEIRPIDVRIIAATNKDLIELVKEKRFREDLFFRLKMGSVYLPPLRERKQDIPDLLKHMVASMTISEVSFTEDLLKKLMDYDWLGNVRELKHLLTYMLAVRTGDVLGIKDLPSDMFVSHHVPLERHLSEYSEEYVFFLHVIKRMKEAQRAPSRTALSRESEGSPFYRSENQVRRLLHQLKEEGLISLHKGKNSIALTEKGSFYANKGRLG